VGPLDGFLDLRRGDPVPGDVADVLHIPIEASAAVEHSHGIYRFGIYSKALDRKP
jgi:hypothetical protein